MKRADAENQQMNRVGRAGVWAAVGSVLAAGAVFSGGASAQDVLPMPPAPFKGQIGLSVKDSKPDFPRPVQAPKGAPNVLLIMLDDVGFAQLGPFGSDIATPTLDRLAGEGLRFNRFHVTALCSPTRAAVLTGRNHHTVGMGFLCDMPTGFPGYSSRLPRSAATRR